MTKDTSKDSKFSGISEMKRKYQDFIDSNNRKMTQNLTKNSQSRDDPKNNNHISGILNSALLSQSLESQSPHSTNKYPRDPRHRNMNMELSKHLMKSQNSKPKNLNFKKNKQDLVGLDQLGFKNVNDSEKKINAYQLNMIIEDQNSRLNNTFDSCNIETETIKPKLYDFTDNSKLNCSEDKTPKPSNTFYNITSNNHNFDKSKNQLKGQNKVDLKNTTKRFSENKNRYINVTNNPMDYNNQKKKRTTFEIENQFNDNSKRSKNGSTNSKINKNTKSDQQINNFENNGLSNLMKNSMLKERMVLMTTEKNTQNENEKMKQIQRLNRQNKGLIEGEDLRNKNRFFNTTKEEIYDKMKLGKNHLYYFGENESMPSHNFDLDYNNYNFRNRKVKNSLNTLIQRNLNLKKIILES
jgi:hypothetical protein